MADTITLADYPAVNDGVTNNNTPIQDAVNAALAEAKDLFWPKGTYLKTISIANFHSVRHVGPGVVKHGTDLFYPDPKGTNSNKLYVSTGGSDTNDGLSSTTSIRKISKAVTVLNNYGPVLGGVWTIQAAAGTYTDRTVVAVGLDSLNPITIQGPIVNHPNVPTAILSEGYNIGAVGIKMSEAKASFIISNFLFSGYNGTTSSAGLQSSSNEGTVQTVNCHFTDCYWGFSNQDGDGDMKGGVLTRCGFLGDTPNTTLMSSRNGNGGGYRGLMHSRHTIGVQNAGVLTNGPVFRSCLSAIFIQESCTGHVDYATIEDCEFGVNLNVSSRANISGTSFKRNSIDLKALANSHVYISASTAFGSGVDESAIKISLMGGAQVTDENRIFSNVNQSYNAMMKITDTKFPNQVIQSTGLTPFYTATLAGNIWRDVPNSTNRAKRITVKIYGELLGTAGTKNIVVRLGTANVTATFTSTEVGKFQAEATIFFNDQAKQLLTLLAQRHLGANSRIAQNPGTNALTSNTNLTAEASVGSASDSVRIDAVDMSWA